MVVFVQVFQCLLRQNLRQLLKGSGSQLRDSYSTE